MQDTYEWRTGRHTVFELYVHLVFTTKYRKKVFTEPMLKRLEEILRNKCSEVDSHLIEFNGETQQVHLLV